MSDQPGALAERTINMQTIHYFRELYTVVMEQDGYHVDEFKKVKGDIPGITKKVNALYPNAIQVFICTSWDGVERVLKAIGIGTAIAKKLMP